MERSIRKFISTVMLTLTLALAVASCQKDQTEQENTVSDTKVTTSQSDAFSLPMFPICSPIPGILNVEEGNKLVLQTFAKGFQIYEVKRSATDPNVFSWVNIAPFATLYARPDFTNELIHHFAGPSWEFIKGPEKGERVVATKVQGVTKDESAIQWLLLKADPARSTPNNKITFIQRICTAAGLAPTTGADEAHLGQLDSIPYTASYLFYTKE